MNTARAMGAGVLLAILVVISTDPTLVRQQDDDGINWLPYAALIAAVVLLLVPSAINVLNRRRRR